MASADSLAENVAWFRTWLEKIAAERPVALVGFIGGATFDGGVLPAEPERFAGPATPLRDAALRRPCVDVAGAAGRCPGARRPGPETDTVIPPGLQARTWEYLHGGSGARVTGRRSPGGHEMNQGDVTAVATWLQEQAFGLAR